MGKQHYRVTGELPVAGHQPGDEFDHDFGDQTDALIGGGHITAVKKSNGKASAEPDESKEG